MADLTIEMSRFLRWASQVSPDTGREDWECNYSRWDDIYDAVLHRVAITSLDEWSFEDSREVLRAMEFDRKREHLAEEIRLRHPATLIVLAQASSSGLMTAYARWQLAEQLGYVGHSGDEAECLLILFASNEDEHVRRRAVGALVRIGSPAVEQLALDAWYRQDEQQERARMMALDSLHRIGSPHFERLRAEAEQDVRPNLRDFAKQIGQGPGH